MLQNNQSVFLIEKHHVRELQGLDTYPNKYNIAPSLEYNSIIMYRRFKQIIINKLVQYVVQYKCVKNVTLHILICNLQRHLTRTPTNSVQYVCTAYRLYIQCIYIYTQTLASHIQIYPVMPPKLQKLTRKVFYQQQFFHSV